MSPWDILRGKMPLLALPVTWYIIFQCCCWLPGCHWPEAPCCGILQRVPSPLAVLCWARLQHGISPPLTSVSSTATFLELAAILLLSCGRHDDVTRGAHVGRCLPQHRAQPYVPPTGRREWILLQESHWESRQKAEGEARWTGQSDHCHHHEWRPSYQVCDHPAHTRWPSPGGGEEGLPTCDIRSHLEMAWSP